MSRQLTMTLQQRPRQIDQNFSKSLSVIQWNRQQQFLQSYHNRDRATQSRVVVRRTEHHLP